MRKNVFGYIRVSTGEQGKKYSLDGQKLEIELYCKNKELELLRIFEDQTSGTKLRERAGLMSLLDSVDKSLTAVIVTEADRLSRDVFHFGWLYTHFMQQGVELILINDRVGTTPSERAFSKVRAVFSEFEHELRQARIERGLLRARENGKFMNRPPLGYRMENNRIVIDEKASVIIKELFTLASNGSSLSIISQRTGVKRSTVASILKNPFYIDGAIHGRHDTFLDPNLWRSVQTRSLKRNHNLLSQHSDENKRKL